jgi:hypothetical protein
MAKLKEKIKELQTTYGITEEAAKAVLALHEGDLADAAAMVAEEQGKVTKWNQWYAENAPNIQASLTELEQLRTKFDTLKAAGVNLESNTNTNTNTNTTNTTPPDINTVLDAREKQIYSNFSAVQRDLYNIQRDHLAKYKELPDLAPIEKLIEEKKMTPWAAYQQWVEPMEKDRTTKELREQITKELTEKFQNDNTRLGVNSFLANRNSLTGEEVTSPLDEVAKDIAEKQAIAAPKAGERNDPSELELLADFTGTMRNGRAGLAH